MWRVEYRDKTFAAGEECAVIGLGIVVSEDAGLDEIRNGQAASLKI